MKKLIIFITLILSIISCTIEEETITIKIDKWHNGIVYYQIDDSISETEKIRIRNSMDDWEEFTNVSFIESNDNKYICKISKDQESHSHLATIGQRLDSIIIFRDLSIFSKRAIAHELGHVLGLVHEHQRPDRDEFIEINYENIVERFSHNFDILDNPLYIESKYNYDYNSIMHYNDQTYSNGRGPTFNLFDKNITYTTKPSALDIEKINVIY